MSETILLSLVMLMRLWIAMIDKKPISHRITLIASLHLSPKKRRKTNIKRLYPMKDRLEEFPYSPGHSVSEEDAKELFDMMVSDIIKGRRESVAFLESFRNSRVYRLALLERAQKLHKDKVTLTINQARVDGEEAKFEVPLAGFTEYVRTLHRIVE